MAHFQCYLYGNLFTLVTDHQPLKWLMDSDKFTGKLARWALMLQEYEFQVVHRARLVNLDANGLSRNPCLSQQVATGARWHVVAFLCLLATKAHAKQVENIIRSTGPIDYETSGELGELKDVCDDLEVLSYLRTKNWQ